MSAPPPHHSHSAAEALTKAARDPDALPHSHSDLSAMARLRQRQLVRLDPALSSSTTSLTWAGSQPVLGSHVSGLDQLHKAPAGQPQDPTDEEDVILAPTGRITVPLAVTAFMAAFGSSLPHGWNTGVLNTPAEHIKDFLNETFTERFDGPPADQLLNLLWSVSVSVYLVGGCGGAFCAGWMANMIGRKKSLLVCHVFGFIASFLFGFCKMAGSFEMFIIARFIVGFGCGAGSGLVPMYLTEIAPVNYRGAMGVLHQFALTIGILLSQIVGLRQLLGHKDRWPILLALTSLPCLVSAVALPWFPESPRYLYVNKKDEEEAKKALQKFRDEEDVSLDLIEMEAELRQQKKEPKWTFLQLFRASGLRMQLALVCVLAVAQQLSGINVVFYYSTDVFVDAGIPPDYTQYATLGTGAINVIMTGISVPLMEKAGRRLLLLGGMIIMVVSAAAMTLALNLKDTVHWMSYFSIICLIFFVVGFATGLGSIPQFIGAELFKQGPRPPAMSFAGLLNWLANVIVGVTFPLMAPHTKAFSFLPFIVLVLGFGAFLWWKLPETKGKTFEEISQHFSGDEKPAPEAVELLDPMKKKSHPGMRRLESVEAGDKLSNGHNSATDIGRLYNSTGVLGAL